MTLAGWEDWSDAAPAAEDAKLLAVFVGASGEPWSAGLAEVFADPGVEEASREFRRLRVDADLRPDLARRLAPSGIPVLAVLAPDGTPLVASGYAPQRTIREMLRHAALQWEVRRPLLLEQVRAARNTARSMEAMSVRPGTVDETFVVSVVEALVESADPVTGLWSAGRISEDGAALRALALRPRVAGAGETLVRALASLARDADFEEARTEDLVDLALAAESGGAVDLARRLRAVVAGFRRDGLWSASAAGPVTSSASFRAAALLGEPPPKIVFSAEGLVPRFPGAPPPFHLADQAAALDTTRDPALASALERFFLDPASASFRDRHAAPAGLEPLASPRFPTVENAAAIAALAGAGRADIARPALAALSDAFLGQGRAAAPLALAAAVLLDARGRNPTH